MPDYFAKHGYKSPSDVDNGPFQFAYSVQERYWDWLAKDERYQHAFNVNMSVQKMVRGQEWFDFFPVADKLRVDEEERVVLVDVGGGVGHDLIEFQKGNAGLKGRLVLEDLPVVIATALDLPPGTTKIGHDFFTPQPPSTHHAKAFYLRSVLHDWPDTQAIQILSNIRDAMADDSMVLINEKVLPEKGVTLFEAMLDWQMMACLAAAERTEAQWRELLQKAGLEVVRIWTGDATGAMGMGWLIEAVGKK